MQDNSEEVSKWDNHSDKFNYIPLKLNIFTCVNMQDTMALAQELIKKQDLEDFCKMLAWTRECPLETINKFETHLEMVENKDKCLNLLRHYRKAGDWICCLCGKPFTTRVTLNRHNMTVACTIKVQVLSIYLRMMVKIIMLLLTMTTMTYRYQFL